MWEAEQQTFLVWKEIFPCNNQHAEASLMLPAQTHVDAMVVGR
jgi:hypothetical protein